MSSSDEDELLGGLYPDVWLPLKLDGDIVGDIVSISYEVGVIVGDMVVSIPLTHEMIATIIIRSLVKDIANCVKMWGMVKSERWGRIAYHVQ